MSVSRRSALQRGTAAFGSLLARLTLQRVLPATSTLLGTSVASFAAETLAAEGPETERHGLSTFGELQMPADFPHFRYVNPKAPKGGLLSIQIKNTTGNQNFETFDTFNIYVFKGDGAAGMDATFDTLMTGSGDEPDALYGLVAKSVRWSADRLTYRFMLRPEAKFHDGSPLRAEDAAFSINILKTKGHPVFRSLLRELASAEAQPDGTLLVKFTPQRARDIHLFVAGLPIFSAAWWKGRDFEASTLEAPLGSGPYKLSRYEQGRFVEFERVKTYWAENLPVNVGQNNFDRLSYSYYRDRTPAFEDFKSGRLNFNEEYTAKFWALAYDFPAVRDGRVKKEQLHSGAQTASQGWYLNIRRPQFQDPRIREALAYAFDFEWTNKNIMFSTYKRLTSFFDNSDMKASGKPSPDELKLLEPWRGKVPDEVFNEPWMPPVSDGSGSDRNLLRKADDLLKAAGCKREGSTLKLPNGQPFVIEFLDSNPALQPHTEPFQANLRKLGIACTSRLVDSAQYKRRLDAFDFDVVVNAMGGSSTPGDGLRIVYGSDAAKTPGSRNLAGISDPAIDAMLDIISKAETRADLNIACRCLDRLLRAGRYWIPMWYRDVSLIAHWDVFERPPEQPKFGTGAPGIWWWNAEKAKALGMEG